MGRLFPYRLRTGPSAGHLLVAVVTRRTFGGLVELQGGVDADFPDSLQDRRRLGAEDDLALLLVAAQFTLDGDVGTLRESGGELSQLPDASMPLGAGFPRSGVVTSTRLWARARTPRCSLRC